jgi:hypothetical protein
MSNTMTGEQPPELCRFVGPLAVPVSTADALHEIATLEGETVSRIIRTALEGYAREYLDYLRSFDALAEQPGDPGE